jgi:mRNA interferase MazF
VNRGEIWIAEVGRKRRPVVIVTRSGVIDVRALVTVAEITTSIRSIAAEVELDHDQAGVDRPSVINCDGLHTIPKTSLTTYVGSIGDDTMREVCSAIAYALGC